jgi:hypothetical protein
MAMSSTEAKVIFMDKAGEGQAAGKAMGYVRSAEFNDPNCDILEETVTEFSAANGYDLLGITCDEGGLPGSRYRPAFEKLIAQIGIGVFSGIIVPSMEHLSIGSNPPSETIRRVRTLGGWVECAQTD